MIRTREALGNITHSFRLNVSIAVGLAAFLLYAASLSGQSLTLTGHVSNIQAPPRQTTFCGCAIGDPVTATIELRTYFVTQVQVSNQREATFPLTAIPRRAGIGLPEMEFAGNSFALQIGKRTWVNQFVTSGEQDDKLMGALQLSSPGSGTLPKAFSNIFSTGFAVREAGNSAGATDMDRTFVTGLDVDSRPSPMWNTTGDPIGNVIPSNRSRIGLSLGGTTFNSVVITVDKVTANTELASQLDLRAALLQEQQRQTTASPSANVPPSGPFLPPPNRPGSAPVKALFQTTPFNPCLQMANAASGVARNLLNLYQERSLIGLAEGTIRADIAEWLVVLGPPTVCTAQVLIQAMASRETGNDGEKENSRSAAVNKAGLPQKGKFRYIPPNNWKATMPLPQGSQGYIDKFGNEWVKGGSRTPGDQIEWDVQLSRTGKASWGQFSSDGQHVNVSMRGDLTH